MTPEQLAKPDTEAAHQTALMCWAAQMAFTGVLPELRWLFHIPNGGSRGADAKGRAIAGGRLKAQGVRVGVADLFLPTARQGVHGLFIEMKKPAERPKKEGSKGGLSDDQIEFAEHVQRGGYGWACCYSWEEARDLLLRYLA